MTAMPHYVVAEGHVVRCNDSECEVCGLSLPIAQRIQDLTDLVRWLALPYGDNSPQFATATWEGAPLEDGKRLAAVYASVVGETRPPVPTAWTQCPTCGMWQTIPVAP
jgi:hypothetical protein